jgi:hypothetical protein
VVLALEEAPDFLVGIVGGECLREEPAATRCVQIFMPAI